MGSYLAIRLPNAHIGWGFSDAAAILLGLLSTLGIYRYGSRRLWRLTVLAAAGFGVGNTLATLLYELLDVNNHIGIPLSLAVWGFIGGAVFTLPSKHTRKILISGGLCAASLVIGYFSTLFILEIDYYGLNYYGFRNIIWGLLFGIVFGLSTRSLPSIVFLAIIGSMGFMSTSVFISTINAGDVWEAALRGIWVGIVLGFGYAFVTRGNKETGILAE